MSYIQDNNQFYTVMWKKNTQTYWQAGWQPYLTVSNKTIYPLNKQVDRQTKPFTPYTNK